MSEPLDPGFGPVLLASGLAALTTTIGIWSVGRFPSWSERNSVYFMAFAAGVLLTVSMIHLVPESVQMGCQSGFVLVGYLALYLLDRVLRAQAGDPHGHGGDSSRHRAIGIIPMVAIGLHSFIDGIIYSITFEVSVFTGVASAIGMVLHEFPEGVVVFVLLIRGGFRRRSAVILAFLAAALTTPLGAALSYPFLERIGQPLLATLLALSGGALLYVGATHLLPEVEHEGRWTPTLALVAGLAVALGVVFFGE